MLNVISTPVLVSSANELISRSSYLYVTDRLDSAEYAVQMANQIMAVLHSRNEDVTALNAKIAEKAQMF
jgi:hypothetical protein